MKLLLPPVILLAAAALALPGAAQERAPVRLTQAIGKVSAPVDLDLTSAGGSGDRTLHLVVRPRVDASTLTVQVQVEEGLALAGGGEWKASARAGEESAHDLPVRVVGPGEQRVVVTATVGYADGAAETALQVFVLNPAPPLRGFARLAQPGVVSGPGGRRVLEVMTGEP